MHWQIMPSSILIALIGIPFIALPIILWRTTRRAKLRKRHKQRSARHLAHQQAWDWLMRRDRHRRLTDQRPVE